MIERAMRRAARRRSAGWAGHSLASVLASSLVMDTCAGSADGPALIPLTTLCLDRKVVMRAMRTCVRLTLDATARDDEPAF
jgi:hypothetical protein